ncbi:RidA family protein [Cerasicoccus maritimus]|uniref:RidA family protein n=1 Tax=Cerasicoccus maritimus TaxID=490089 RepID=UPI00285250E7|nr:RidA family protein [Cerasicoccus maritimus]
MSIEARLTELGYELPAAPAPAGSYVPFVRVGNILHLAGAICLQKGEMTHTGKVGKLRDIKYGQDAAAVCVLNSLAVVKSAVGSLDAIKQVVMVNGFVNADEGFTDSPAVINGASDLLVSLLGDKGKHARAAVAVSGLPKDTTVEIQMIVEVE